MLKFPDISLITAPNEVAKVMFLHVSVILSTGGGGVPGPGGPVLVGTMQAQTTFTFEKFPPNTFKVPSVYGNTWNK